MNNHQENLTQENKEEAQPEQFVCQKQCGEIRYWQPRNSGGQYVNLAIDAFDRLKYGCPEFSFQCWGGQQWRNSAIICDLAGRGIPEIFRRVSFEKSKDSQALKLTRIWAQTGFKEGGALLLAGDTGIGKTHATVCFLRGYLNESFAEEEEDKYFNGVYRGPSYSFHYAPAMFNKLRFAEPGEKIKQLNRIKDSSLLILDDLGAEKETEFSQAALDEIIWHREANRLPTIITTNKQLKELAAAFGARIADRLKGWAMILHSREKSLRTEEAA